MIHNFDELKAMLAASPVKRRIGVVAAQDEHTLDAVTRAARDGMVFPVLIGDPDKIKTLLAEFDYPEADAEIIPSYDITECAQIACDLVNAGKLDCIRKGKTETGPLMKVLVNREKGIRKSDTMSMMAVMSSPNYPKIFAITDVGLLTYPTQEQKKAAIENAVGAFHALGIETPKVAILAAMEKVNPKMPECVEADAIKAEGVPGCVIEAPSVWIWLWTLKPPPSRAMTARCQATRISWWYPISAAATCLRKLLLPLAAGPPAVRC